MAICLPHFLLTVMRFIFRVCLLTPLTALAMSGEVMDGEGAPLMDVVITLTPLLEDKASSENAKKTINIVMDQQKREFVPHVLPVKAGTHIVFPNSDDIQHHVYSFSSAKRFEIKLYKDTPANAIVFNQAGVVAIGCNIHDWMVGYIYVADAPYFGKTDASGRWNLDVPAGEYRLALWHPDVKTSFVLPNEVVHVPSVSPLRHSILLKSHPQTGKPPSSLQLEEYAGDF